MSEKILNENIALKIRKEQALQLNITIDEKMTQDVIEQKIIHELDEGMKDLKNILDEISFLEN